MRRVLRNGVLITFGILSICIVSGCTPDDEDDECEEVWDSLHPEEEYDGPPSATVVVVDPPPGATLPSDQQFTLTFDQGVTAASVNGAAAAGYSLNWTASPALPEGVVTLSVGWTNRDGSADFQAVGPYFIRNPDVTSPVIVDGTVRDRDRNVDPVLVNAGGLWLDFNEEVTGTVKLTDEAGVNLNWIGNVVGATATLTPVAGQELVNETTYKIEIDVQDGAGNATRATITFVTKPK